MENLEPGSSPSKDSRVAAFLQRHLGVLCDPQMDPYPMGLESNLFQPKCDVYDVGNFSCPDTSRRLSEACASPSSSIIVTVWLLVRLYRTKFTMGSGAMRPTTTST